MTDEKLPRQLMLVPADDGRVFEVAESSSESESTALVAGIPDTGIDASAARVLGLEDETDPSALGFMARFLVMCTLPHRDPGVAHYERVNGALTLSIMNRPAIGLPYGRYARLIMAWICSETVRTGSPELQPGNTLSEFMDKLGIHTTGGRQGTIQRLRDQMVKLLTSMISVSATGTADAEGATWDFFHAANASVTSEFALWRQRAQGSDEGQIKAGIRLSPDFYKAIIDRPVPLDLKVFHGLRAPLAMDLYVWLGYRAFVLERSGKSAARIPWELLQNQMGADYGRPRAFRQKTEYYLSRVLPHLPGIAVKDRRGALELRLLPKAKG